MKWRKETLCWYCDKAGGNCSWSAKFQPVDGWNAIPTRIQTRDNPKGYVESYRVLDCPEFELLKAVENNGAEKLKWYKLMIASKGENDGV